MRLKSLLIVPLLVASLQAASVDDLTFTLNVHGYQYSVTNCIGGISGSLEIPSTYNGLPVTSIADMAFIECFDLFQILSIHYCVGVLDNIILCDSISSPFILNPENCSVFDPLMHLCWHCTYYIRSIRIHHL